jgi:hypothetical protein
MQNESDRSDKDRDPEAVLGGLRPNHGRVVRAMPTNNTTNTSSAAPIFCAHSPAPIPPTMAKATVAVS